MHVTKVAALCLLVTITMQLQAITIAELVKATQDSVVQVCNDIATSELGIACVHTFENFQAWVAQRPLQAGTVAGVLAFITCYWLSKRTAQYRSMCQQTEAYNDGFEDGYMHAYRSYRSKSIWV